MFPSQSIFKLKVYNVKCTLKSTQNVDTIPYSIRGNQITVQKFPCTRPLLQEKIRSDDSMQSLTRGQISKHFPALHLFLFIRPSLCSQVYSSLLYYTPVYFYILQHTHIYSSIIIYTPVYSYILQYTHIYSSILIYI